MTNGEMMQKIFPDMEIEIGEIDAYVWINHEPSHFDKTWWNAEYKEPNYSEIPTGSMDYISKQEVVGLMMHIWGENFSGDDAMQKSIDAIRDMPSVTPQEPRKGHWISHREHCENLGVMPSGLGAYEWCSNCDCGIDVREWHRNHYNYCPNCGVKMVEPQKSEDKEQEDGNVY